MHKLSTTYLTTLFVSIFFLTSSTLFGQQEQIKWLTWEEAIALSKNQQKMFFVDIYTDWCGWCKRMDKNTLQEPGIVSFINENYYPIRFNAEYKNPIELKDKIYNYVKNGKRGYHELAAMITYGRLSFPTVVFLDEDMNVIQPICGYQDPKNFKMIMRYFAEGFYKTTPWDAYQINYQKN